MERLQQLDLFETAVAAAAKYDIAITPEVFQWLKEGAAYCAGVSGGKDSVVMAVRTAEYLDEIGHTGPRVLIHSDLGSVEWKDSLPVCERLAKQLGWELIVVRREAGGMMERWSQRWENCRERYRTLSSVRLILPWSTPSMRFCTSELKSAVIARALTLRFPGQKIISATGVRHAESAARAKMPIAEPNTKLSARGCQGMNWNPIAPWSTPSVFEYIALKQAPLHEAYTKYGSTRVSCAFCIMSSANDLNASASCPDNADIYRTMVQLEIESTFAFQGAKWLGDQAPHLLSQEAREALVDAKRRAALRIQAEARLPKHLLYTAGWPDCIPSDEEAQLIAEVRIDVAAAMGFEVEHTTAESVKARYQELINLRIEKEQRNKPKRKKQ